MINLSNKGKVRNPIYDSGLVGVHLELNLPRLQNLAILRDRIVQWQTKTASIKFSDRHNHEELSITNDMIKILNFICGDIQSPLSNNLWDTEEEVKINNEL